MKNKTALLLCFCFCAARAAAQIAADNIRLNQIGFYPAAPKIAVLVGTDSGAFYLADARTRKKVYTGRLSETRTNVISKKKTRIADFSAFQKPGKYILMIPDAGASYPFLIEPNVHRAAATGAVKGFYYQRASTALPEKYAGKWARPEGHPDDSVLIHPSAATEKRPAGTVISSPRGWYDAGDYNKYVVNSGITMGTLFSLYEDFPDYVKGLPTNIPESGNGVPDLLNEALWNLRWMLTMQDPDDGGVYHKLTNAAFDPMVMPEQARKPRYVVQKNTIAALDFAAVVAQAARIFKGFPKETPGLADSCLTAAVKAWKWAEANPDDRYRQNDMNGRFEPKITTGGYEDGAGADEWIWAASELYITTREDTYYQAVQLLPDTLFRLPSWNQVALLGYYSLLRQEKTLTALGKKDLPALKQKILAFSDRLLQGVDQQAFNTVMGRSAKDFIWGSSAVAANEGIALIQAFRISGSKKYLRGALSNIDYLLGRNATGYSFLTGFGARTPMHIHHRPSEADGVADPVPGLLSGGTNPGQQDKCSGYPTKIADESYLDAVCAYASNEIAINWNAPLVYLLAAMEALQKNLVP